jgi:hypothetical protein
MSWLTAKQSPTKRAAPRVRSAAVALATAGMSAALLAALASSARATAHVGATRPSTTVEVTLENSTVILSPMAVPTGTVDFKIVNRSRLRRDFEVAGRKTPPIPAGKTATLNVRLRTQGPRTFASTTRSRPSRLTGVLDVFEPCTNPVATTVTVKMAQDMGGITVSQATIPCGTVTFVVTNAGTVTDSLQIFTEVPALAESTPELQAGRTATLTIRFVEKGVVFYQSGDFPPAEPEYSGDVLEEGHFILD